MNLSILHISDLHRDRGNPIRNDVLLDSLENDARHYSDEEGSEVRAPDLLVVSGDIIQGVSSDNPEPEKCLREQYDEASDFLARITERFFGGDRERVVIVPGNHDVSAYHVYRSLERVAIPPDQKTDLIDQLFLPESPLRWSWSDFSLFRISDSAMYMQRMAAFSQFYCDFYCGKRTYDLDPSKQIDVFDYPEFDLTIVGFSSCYNNDPFNKRGAIHPGCIAEAGIRLRSPLLASRLRLAVWHHNTEGPPGNSDYMDPDFLQNLIDRGFSLGLHGHQHRPQYLDTRFRHGLERKITVISAGTLCGGSSFRHGRAYNVIEFCTTEKVGRLHVREMQNDNLSLPIWGRRPLSPYTRPYYEFEFDPPPSSVGDASTTVLVQAQNLHSNGEYKKASDLLKPIVHQEELARRLLLDCLVEARDSIALLEIYDPPSSDAEAIHVMEALWEEGRQERLAEIIDIPLVAESTDLSVAEIRRKYRARLK